MKTKALLILSASLTALLATACGGAFAQSPFGAVPSSDGTNIAYASAADDSNSAMGPTPAAIDGPAPPTSDGMTPATARLSGSDVISHAKAQPVNVSGSSDSAPDMTDPTKTKI